MSYYTDKLSFCNNKIKSKEITTMLDFQFTAIASLHGTPTQQIVTGKKLEVTQEATSTTGEKGYLNLYIGDTKIEEPVPYEFKKGSYRMTQHDVIQALKTANLVDVTILTITTKGCKLLTKKGCYINTDDQPMEID